jgi:hypothetical protein
VNSDEDDALDAWDDAKAAEAKAWERYNRVATGRPVDLTPAEKPKSRKELLDSGLAYYRAQRGEK